MSEYVPRTDPYTAEGADALQTQVIPAEGDLAASQQEAEAKPIKRGLLRRLAESARRLDSGSADLSVPPRSNESAVDMINRLNPGQLLPMERPVRRESAADMVNRLNPGMIIPERPPQGRIER